MMSWYALVVALLRLMIAKNMARILSNINANSVALLECGTTIKPIIVNLAIKLKNIYQNWLNKDYPHVRVKLDVKLEAVMVVMETKGYWDVLPAEM